MDIVLLITSVAFFLWVIRNILYWVWLWQENEYRFDMMRYSLTKTTHGRELWLSYLGVLKLFGLFLFIPTIFNEALAEVYYVYVLFVFCLHGLVFIKEILFDAAKLPRITLRSLFVIFPTFLLTVLFYYNPIIDIYLWLLIIDRFVLVFVTVFLFALSFPSEVYRDLQTEAAKRRIRQLTAMQVIGVTGGVNKEPTTYMIHQILSNHLKTVRTQRGPNTLERLSWRVKKRIPADTQAFVAQIDAVKKGEVFETVDMLRPHIGVITAIPKYIEQTDGGVHDVQQTHLELYNELPPDGLFLLNGTDPAMRKLSKVLYTQMEKRIKRKRPFPILFSQRVSVDEHYSSREIIAINTVIKKESLAFDFVFGRKTYHFRAPLVGRQYIDCLLPAITIAHHLGFTFTELKHIVSHLVPYESCMIPYKSSTGVTLVDQSYSSDPAFVTAAMEYMQLFKGKKIVVLTPLSSITKYAHESQYELAKQLAKTCDYLFLTNRHATKDIVRGFYESGGSCIIKHGSKSAISGFIAKQLKGKEDIALFIGSETKDTLKETLKRLH